MKPPLGLALAKFSKGFDPDMAYQIREREPLTLEDMQKGAISVEAIRGILRSVMGLLRKRYQKKLYKNQ